MGCVCSHDDTNIESKNEFYQINYEIEPKIKTNPKLMDNLIRLQSIVKGRYFRKNFKKILSNEIKEEPLTYKYITTNKVDQKTLEELFQLYPPLNDGIEVEVRSPAQFSNNKVIYFGEWDKINNLRHGRGIQIWLDGATFLGCWKKGKACGKGKLIHADGDVYDGDWVDDKPTGYGIYIHSDGTRYDGEWKDDKQNGKGKEIWPDGTSYEGDYVDGKKQGYGIFKWADNSMYKGEFENNNIHGKGIYTFADGRKYDGDWVNNRLEGKGTFTWPDGRKYTGDYKNDKKEGIGLFEWRDGKKYKGEWKNGKQHGFGEYYDPNEDKWRKGVWEYGKRIKWIND